MKNHNPLPAYDVAIYLDSSGRISQWTKQAEKIFGKKKTATERRKLTEIVIPEDNKKQFAQELNSFISEAKGKIRSAHFEFNISKDSKKTVCIEITIVSIPGEKEKAFSVFIKDNTERSKMQEELRKSELRYRTLIDQASDAVMITDPKGIFIDVNSCLCKMFDYKREELIGKNVSMVIDSDNLKNHPIRFDLIMSGQTIVNERKMVHRDGTIIEVEATVKRFPDDRIVAIARNITARKKMEKVLRESEFMFRKVTENEIVGVAWATPDATLLNANNAFCRMLGYSIEELKGVYFRDLTHPDDVKKERELLEQLIKGKKEYYQIEKRYRTKEGQYIWVELNLSVYRNPKTKLVEFFIGIIKDINERKKTEDELKKSHEQLRQLSSHLQKVREEERSNIAREIHDVLGHQLTSLKMDAVMVNKKIDPENKLVREKISSMISLLDETVKTVRHISAQLRPGILDDLGLVDALDWQSNDFENRTGIRIRFTSTFDDKDFEKQIATGIFRVYQETLTNITRHASATEIKTRLESVDDNIVLQVKDNGVGFDTSSIKTKRTLGLIGMEERAKMFGGNFIIESEKNIGTTVTLKVPLQALNEKASADGLQILIADDHNIMRKGLRDFLLEEFPDANIVEVSNGNDLLRMTRKQPWNIVISDVSMPGKNGLDTMKQLKVEFPKLPVLILSMHPEEQYAVRALRAGASGYLTKESAPEELVNAVRKILEGKRYISPNVADKLAEFVESGTTDTPHESLSDREFDVLKMIASGNTVGEIAGKLSISVTTVSTYRSRILQKMKLRTNAELTHYAVSSNLV